MGESGVLTGEVGAAGGARMALTTSTHSSVLRYQVAFLMDTVCACKVAFAKQTEGSWRKRVGW